MVDANNPRAVILAALKGYMSFAFDNSSMFHLMFGGFERDNTDEVLSHASQQSYQVLRDICAPLAPGNAGVEGTEILVWSIIHGYVGIMLNSNSPSPEDFDPVTLLELIFPDLPMSDLN